MRRQLLSGLLVLVGMTMLTGIAYPLLVTGIAQVAFSYEADGSIIEVDGAAVGSELIGQAFPGPEWFHPRPSAASIDGYDAMSSAASNLGPSSPVLLDRVAERVSTYRRENGLPASVAVPVDAVTASASGLDPHISLVNARLQAPRVAEARGLDAQLVLALVEDHVDRRPLGVLGDPGVNVLILNLALDRAEGSG